MFNDNAITTNRRRTAHRAAIKVCARVRSASHIQGLSFGSLRKLTGLSLGASLRLWLGLNPSVWAIERSRKALGLSTDQVWTVV